MITSKINIVMLYLCYTATTIQSIKQSTQPKYSTNYGVNQKCSISEYTCANNNCISAAKFCDNNDDCGDASDEPRFCTSKFFGGIGGCLFWCLFALLNNLFNVLMMIMGVSLLPGYSQSFSCEKQEWKILFVQDTKDRKTSSNFHIFPFHFHFRFAVVDGWGCCLSWIISSDCRD